MWQQSDIPFDRARRLCVAINRQPSWVTKASLFAGATVMLLIVLLLVIPAILVGVVVFGVLALFYRLKAALTGALPRSDGRRNVTVVRRDPPGGF